MHPICTPFIRTPCIGLLAAASLLGLSALAQSGAPTVKGSPPSDPEALALCAHLPQDPAACRREFAAAREAARQGQLSSAPDYSAHALARCAVHPPAERASCEARVTGSGQTRVQGSVMGGGLIRETVSTELLPAPDTPVAPPATAPAPVQVFPEPHPLAPSPSPSPAPQPQPVR